MKDLKNALTEYKEWLINQSWFEKGKEYVIEKEAPSPEDLKLLVDKFGDLPVSYLEVLIEFGLSEFANEHYKTIMLPPKKILELYDVVQSEMDFADGLREEILEEDELDFADYIPVMAGEGEDGCWALLNVGADSNGEIMYWDTDQAGVIDYEFENLEEFILQSLAKAKQGDYLRLT